MYKKKPLETVEERGKCQHRMNEADNQHQCEEMVFHLHIWSRYHEDSLSIDVQSIYL